MVAQLRQGKAMQWERIGPFAFAADGYRIAVTQHGDALLYSAFAPEIPNERFKLMLRPQYARGEPVPQQREPLGVFSTDDDARQACQRHVDQCPHNPISPGG
jgi:hypothetical protein